MVDFVGEVKLVTSHDQSGECLWVMMPTDMKVSRYLIDKHKSTKRASLFCSQSLDSAVKHLLATPLSLRCIMPVFIQLFLLCILLRMPCLIDMHSLLNNIAILIKSILMQFPLNIHHMYPCNIHNVKTQNIARTFWQSDIDVDV
jgi:hypothetical protein